MKWLWFFAIFILIEVYAFKGIRMVSASVEPMWRRIITVVFWLSTVATYGGLIYLGVRSKTEAIQGLHAYKWFNIVGGTAVFFVSIKLLLSVFHLLSDLVNGAKFLWIKLSTPPLSESHESMSRIQFFNQLGLGVAAAWAGTLLYGVWRGKFDFRVLSEVVTYPDLPEEFNGLRIVQISDTHLGSFNGDFEEVQKGFDLINSLDADYVMFTGDLINNFSDEAEGWIEKLKSIRARFGKFSILGNHDYGDYALRDFPVEKEKSFNRLIKIHEEAGFKLLRNEHVYLEKNGQRIVLVGCENWGVGFHQYGDLDKALEGTQHDEFKILLSHDPTHWEEKVLGKENIALTLSGHTHGAQMGLELPQFGIKVSPSALRYKRWAGLYSERNQHLYINRGFGYLGFPGRVGMAPEITLIELKRG